MNRNLIARRLGLIIMGILLFSIVIIFLSMYRANYKEITKAAGVELYGCAYITTALVEPDDIEKIKSGDLDTAKRVGEDISWTIQHKDIFEGQYMMDLDGKLLAVDENILEQGFAPGDDFYIDEETLEQLKITKAPVYSDVYEFGGMKRLTGYAPIFVDHDPEKDVIAISAIDFESSILHSRTWDMIKGSFFTAIVPILLAGLATIYLIQRTIAPLRSITEFANRVAEGDLTTERLTIKSNDEIGQLSQDLNKMADNLTAIIGDLATSSTQVATTSSELTASVEQVSVVAEENLQSVNEVKVGSQEQVNIVHSTNQTLATISDKTDHISERSEALNTASQKTTERAEDGSKIIVKSINQMDTINSQAEDMSQSVVQLSEKSEEISDIISLINDISVQTNLLALNASIEATRAGESGQGFAVVATEIRQLAEQSAGATSKISDLIHEIQTDTANVVEMTNGSIESMKVGTEIIQDAGQAFNYIEESVHNVTNEIATISEDISHIALDIEEILHSMDEIESISTNMADNTTSVLAQSEEQAESIEEINMLMEKMSEMAEDLNERTHRFKL